jgi:hypothetical protein
MHSVVCLSLNRLVRPHYHAHILSSHMFNHGVKLSTSTIEKCDRLARLHA